VPPRAAVAKLTGEFLTIEAEGSYDKAADMVKRLGVVRPEVWGSGFAGTNRILRGNPSLLLLVELFVAKIAATAYSTPRSTHAKRRIIQPFF